MESLSQVRIGAKAGYLNSKIELGAHHYGGYSLGATGSIPVGSFSNIIAELLFSKRGYSYDNAVVSEGKLKEIKVVFNYVDLPVMYELKVLPFFTILGGGYIGIQGGRSVYYSGVKQSNGMLGKKQVFDYGLLAGMRFYYRHIFFEGQYQHGLSNPFKDTDVFKSRCFGVNLGFMLPL